MLAVQGLTNSRGWGHKAGFQNDGAPSPTGLHTASSPVYQGVSGMRSRVQETVFWPGMSKDIEEVRLKCPTCCRMDSSQPRLPPGEAVPPTYPFQAIAADYFSVQVTKYL